MRLIAVGLLAACCLLGQARFDDVAMAGSEIREDDLPAIAAAPDGSVWLAWLSYSDRNDEIALRRRQDGVWGNMLFVPNTSGDSWLPQIGVTADNKVWVVWSQQLDGNWDLYSRFYDPEEQAWGALTRLTEAPQPDVNPRMTVGPDRRMALVWQGFRNGKSNIYLKTLDGGAWSDEVQVTGRPGNEWEPAVAIDSGGTAWVVYDSYKNGNYDVYMTGVRNGAVTVPEMAVAETPLFETRATVAVDDEDRVWTAYETGRPNWGKDTGYTIRESQPGATLGNEREVRIRCYANGRLQAPAASLQTVFTAAGADPQWTYQPHVFADGAGSVWVAAKRRLTAKLNRGYWEYYLTRYDGSSWEQAAAFPSSWGRSSTRLNAARMADGSLFFAWPTDNRPEAFAHRPNRNAVHVGRVAAGIAAAPALRPAEDEAITVRPLNHPNEAADLDAIRGYRTTVHGRPVRIVRGDFHRHTELSWDVGGGNDGNLQDFYRYMIDAAAMDFGASTDHQGGANDYWWWYSQKMTDMYLLPGAYTPIYGFERSATQPNGHRNVFYAERTGEVVPFYMRDGVANYSLGNSPIGDMPAVGTGALVRDDTKHLYDEIRRMDGLAISHTSGTRMGTDWRDNDPELEPVVEIFQGARTNYEYQGAPLALRPGVDDGHAKRAGFHPEGFVTHAWEKGYRLGIITSSDHGSTHYSYAMVYTDRATRQGILDAIRRRHTYGATDNILLDVRMGRHFMGDEFHTSAPVPMRVAVRGTNDLDKVHVLRGPNVIYTHTGDGQEASFEYTDTDRASHDGTQYYYVRVEQRDGQIAWSSPIWVNY